MKRTIVCVLASGCYLGGGAPSDEGAADGGSVASAPADPTDDGGASVGADATSGANSSTGGDPSPGDGPGPGDGGDEGDGGGSEVSDGGDSNGSDSGPGPMGDPDAPCGEVPDGELLQGFGADTPGGAGGVEIHVTEATADAVTDAFAEVGDGSAIVIFDVTGPIPIDDTIEIGGAFVTVLGNCVTLDGGGLAATQALVTVTGHDVIVSNIRLRNGGDNLRAEEGAYNVVFTHVSSTGARDDGIAINKGAHDVTVQYSFLAGNTRSIFIKYDNPTDITLHHSWLMKQWVRGPMVNEGFADLRNLVVEDWTLWGTRFENGGRGNAVHSVWRLSSYAKGLGGKTYATVYAYDGSDPQEIYVEGNLYEGEAEPNDSLLDAAPTPFEAPFVTTHEGNEIADVVEPNAGAMPRDGVDQAYIDADDWDVGESTPFIP